MSQIETTLSKCNVLTFFLTEECHWHLNKFLLDFRRNSIFQWKTSWSKIFWLAEPGTEMEGEGRRRNCWGFLLEFSAQSYPVHLRDRSGAGNGTWTATHPLTCSALHSAEGPTLTVTQRSSEVIPLSGKKIILVVSCSAWLRGSRSCTPVCPCPFQAHSDLVLWSTDQSYQHSQNNGI